MTIRQHLANVYETEQEWKSAADALIGIPLETGQKQYSDDMKLGIYLKIAQVTFINLFFSFCVIVWSIWYLF